jgi:hypothetical protein
MRLVEGMRSMSAGCSILSNREVIPVSVEVRTTAVEFHEVLKMWMPFRGMDDGVSVVGGANHELEWDAYGELFGPACG